MCFTTNHNQLSNKLVEVHECQTEIKDDRNNFDARKNTSLL